MQRQIQTALAFLALALTFCLPAAAHDQGLRRALRNASRGSRASGDGRPGPVPALPRDLRLGRGGGREGQGGRSALAARRHRGPRPPGLGFV